MATRYGYILGLYGSFFRSKVSGFDPTAFDKKRPGPAQLLSNETTKVALTTWFEHFHLFADYRTVAISIWTKSTNGTVVFR